MADYIIFVVFIVRVHRCALSPSNSDGDLRFQNVQKNAADEQTAEKTNRNAGKCKRCSAYPLREMRNVDAAKKRSEPEKFKNILLFGKLYGTSGQRLRELRTKN